MDIVSSHAVDSRFVTCSQEHYHPRHPQHPEPLQGPCVASVLVMLGNCVAEQVPAFAACVASAEEAKQMIGTKVCAEAAPEVAG